MYIPKVFFTPDGTLQVHQSNGGVEEYAWNNVTQKYDCTTGLYGELVNVEMKRPTGATVKDKIVVINNPDHSILYYRSANEPPHRPCKAGWTLSRCRVTVKPRPPGQHAWRRFILSPSGVVLDFFPPIAEEDGTRPSFGLERISLTIVAEGTSPPPNMQLGNYAC